jgi:UDP-N-acetyl-D-mannosaminuronic acid dehydrogenase
LGYIGLPTAAVLANKGYKVTGVDINNQVIKNLKNGKVHIVEKGLENIFKEVIKNKNLKIQREVPSADVFIIAVPTPFLKVNNKIPTPNVEFVIQASKEITKVIKPDNLVILESTSPVGTTNMILNEIQKNSHLLENEINVAYCPERVLPGNILKELEINDRVIGGINLKSAELAKEIYSSFCSGTIHITNSDTAELVKLTENAFRDVNLAFANEMSIICDELNIDIKELISLANKHPRVNILNPGCGVGGHCIAIDPWFIASQFPDKSDLIQTARKTNNQKSLWVIEKIKLRHKYLSIKLNKAPVIGFLGLTFKADVDDIRESPALDIVKSFLNTDIQFLVCEPNLSENNFLKLHALKVVIEKADFLVFLVPHKEFKNINFGDKEYLDLCGALN